jgi:hypothetical protein
MDEILRLRLRLCSERRVGDARYDEEEAGPINPSQSALFKSGLTGSSTLLRAIRAQASVGFAMLRPFR